MKILVVDDDELIRELLVEILTAHGYEDVTQAESGEDGLEKIQAAAQPFDCFMFDIQMPGKDGIELCGDVRNMVQYKDTPVVMITAMNNQDYIGRAFSAGATDYVTKPFDTTELITRIRLADRLQAETKRASQAAVTAQAKPKPPFSEPIAITEIRGFVNSAILENYVLINLEQKHFPLAAVAINIPELSAVHAGSGEGEFTYVLTDIAEVLADLLCGAQAFMSYVGNGTFLCVGNRHKIPATSEMQSDLIVMLNDPDLVYCDEVQTSFTALVGEKSAPKLFEKREDLRFLNRALESLSEAGAANPGARTKKLGDRLGVPFAA
ncbi:response regulator transcription factor [Shimia sp. CNT1-13L.2]|jgi:CheY-like chemotaxis protein|uniref:response regulator transcription factor n=1 Tax=Shimia sp. CNT1-13L.2 TaxID=2959663 RepID=UPI0020CCE181|nr:response regulator transcription factor [Shimia sp. CNT1-13L.2]MCP9481100.1 response regulator transcription factor [Shimia sp. CNT1-13L.2]